MSAELSQTVPVISFIPNTVVLMLAFRCKVGLRDTDSDITTTTFTTARHDSKVAVTATTSNDKCNVRTFTKTVTSRNPTLSTSAVDEQNEILRSLKFRGAISPKTVTVNKDSTSSVSRKLVEVCRCFIINNKHSLLKWTYFSKLLSSARDQRPMPSCFFFPLRLFRSRVLTLWRHLRPQVCDRVPL